MINGYYGTIIDGSTSIQSSISEEEIIPNNNRYFNFSLQNDQDCNISLNGGDYIYIRAGQGLFADVVFSCKIQQLGITFNWVGTKS